jgi:serine/threonine protein kinase
MKTQGTEILGSRYRILRPLGGGGMKSLYLAQDLKLSNRLCAVAVMIDNFANPSERQAAIDSFQREANMLAALRNEHIPQIYDRFNDQQNHYLVMEFVEGDTLDDRIKTAGKLSELQTINIAIQILDTLEYLHGLNPPVIYRDMKPSNVMIAPDGKVKLIDFGIARFFQTSTMTTMGTPGYAPSEQYGGKAEERSDLYALAATMHEALTGRTPIPFDFPPLGQLRTGSNTHLSDLLKRALADSINDRVSSAREFKKELLAIRSELAAPLQATTQPNELQNDRTNLLRKTAAQPGGQTWVFNNTTQMAGVAGRGSASVRLSPSRRSLNVSPSSSLSSSRDIACDEERTEVLARGQADSCAAAANQGPDGHAPAFSGASRQLPRGRSSILKTFVGIASLVVFVAVGINQWNEIEHEKAMIAAHQAFEQQQQLALQEAERQRQILLQQEAQREAQLRRQRQLEAALERRREWQTRHAQQQTDPYYPQGESTQSAAGPDGGGMGQALAEGLAGAVGGAVGETIGQVIAGGISGSRHRNH